MRTENNTTRDRIRSSSLVQAWLVLVLAVGFGVALAGVQQRLGPVIERNKTNEALQRVPELVLGKALADKMAAEGQALAVDSRQVAVDKAGRRKFYRVFEARYQGDLKGWVVKAKGQGYADTIELLLGLSPDLKTISGLFVLEQKETPGLGNKIVTDAWRRQFIDAPVGRGLTVVKTGAAKPGEIDAVTGATISSKSVAAIVNTAVADLRRPLTAAAADTDKGGATQ